MDDADVIGVRATEELLLQSQCVYLKTTSEKGLRTKTKSETPDSTTLKSFSFETPGRFEYQITSSVPEHVRLC